MKYFRCSACQEDRQRFENAVLRKLNEVLAIVRENNQGTPGNRRENYDLLPEMPLTTIEALTQFDQNLGQNEGMRNQFVSIFFCFYILFDPYKLMYNTIAMTRMFFF